MVLNIATAMCKVYSQIILFVNYYKLNQLKLFKYSGEYGEGFKLSYKFAAYLLLRSFFNIYIVFQKLVFCMHYKKGASYWINHFLL